MCLNRVLQLSPDNAIAKKELNILKEEKRLYKKKEKKMSKRMGNGLFSPPNSHKAVPNTPEATSNNKMDTLKESKEKLHKGYLFFSFFGSLQMIFIIGVVTFVVFYFIPIEEMKLDKFMPTVLGSNMEKNVFPDVPSMVENEI